MSDLYAPCCSIARTRRRRFLWAAWWSAAPTREPFRPPDAASGGARTHDEALAEALVAGRAAGVTLIETESSWARAWLRVVAGEPPWPRTSRPPEVARGGAARGAREASAGPSVWATLGVSVHATPLELKRAYRARALVVHPDHGGTAEAFRALSRAYEEAVRRSARPRKNRPR